MCGLPCPIGTAEALVDMDALAVFGLPVTTTPGGLVVE
jgi:hypothetical protein